MLGDQGGLLAPHLLVHGEQEVQVAVGEAEAVDTPVGRVPTREALDLSGLDLSEGDLSTLLDVDADVWAEEAALIPDFYGMFGDRLPQAVWDLHAALTARIEETRAAAIAAE